MVLPDGRASGQKGWDEPGLRDAGPLSSDGGAAAVGMAARALDEAIAHVRRRTQFGQPLASFQATQLRIAEMATELQPPPY